LLAHCGLCGAVGGFLGASGLFGQLLRFQRKRLCLAGLARRVRGALLGGFPLLLLLLDLQPSTSCNAELWPRSLQS
jgi:hypothetical protein